LPQSSHPILSMQDLKLDLTEQPCILSLWREVPRWAGWKSLPENGFPKAPLWCQQLTRGVCNNIGDVSEKSPGVWGESPVLDPLLAGKSANHNQASTTEPFGVAIVLLGACKYINNVLTLK
jgi:hypothetical protein